MFSVLLPYVLFLVGFLFLIKGADFLVDGSASIAKRFHIPEIVIGLTIVSMGTSAPELVVSVMASLSGSTDIAVGNVIGSNIANVLLILGVSAFIYPLMVHRNTFSKEIPFSLLAVLVMMFLANDTLIDGAAHSAITRIDGLILLSFFAIFMYYVVTIAKSDKDTPVEDFEQQSLPWSILYLVLGLIGLTIGGYWIVENAKIIASAWGMSESLIGLTVVAIGTSLPELATSAVAALKHNSDIAVGNVVGSNIMNIFWILGVASVITPLPFSSDNNGDIIMLFITSIVLFLFIFTGKKYQIERWQGVLFIVAYIGYLAYLIFTKVVFV